MDALDEFPKDSRDVLLQTLCLINAANKSIHMFVTSRHELDISEALDFRKVKSVNRTFITLDSRQIALDISLFSRCRLEDEKFCYWKPELKQDVERELVQRSQGMKVQSAKLLLIFYCTNHP